MKRIEWEAIDEELYEEAGEGDIVQVSSTEPYMDRMATQNRNVLKYLKEKYPERKFRISRWYPHDFGAYQEVEEGIEYSNEYEDEL